MLKLYAFPKVNAYARGHTRDLRVLWALQEVQLPFQIAGMDHPAHDLNTEASRKLWLEWKRRIDPDHYLDPKKRGDAMMMAGLAFYPG